MSDKEFKELLKRELPIMIDKLTPWRPWTGVQQQIAIRACEMVLGGKVK